MILPIYGFGARILREVAADIDETYPDLDLLIRNMWETMYNAKGVGLAAPQIGKSIRLFIIDTMQLHDESETDNKGIKRVFINAHKEEEDGDVWKYEEGCLSIPEVRGDVDRLSTVRLKYHTPGFGDAKTETFSGIEARVILHEYDHLEGRLFTELLKPIKKRRIKKRLDLIKKGLIDSEYPMRFI